MSVSTVMETTSSFARSAWTELSKQWSEFSSGSPQSWLKLVLEWVKETKAGKLAAGLLAVAVARTVNDKLTRYWFRYPPGTIGFIPWISTFELMNPANDDFLLKDKEKYGPITLHYLGSTAFVMINTLKAGELVFDGRVLNRDGICTKEERNEADALYAPLVGPSHFGDVNEEANWSQRRKKFVRAQGALLKSDTVATMIAQYFEAKVAPQITSGEVWTKQREILVRISFNTMLHFGFSSKIDCSEEEMTEFIDNVLMGFSIFRFLFIGRAIASAEIGAKLVTMLAGDKKDALLKAKEQTKEWFGRFQELPDRSDAQYAEWLLNWVDEGGIDFDHANADLGSLFLAGTHTTTTNTEQILMHCARNPELAARMRDDLKKEFNDPSEFTLDRIRNQTPLVYAFVLESLRLSEIVRLNLPRVLTEDLSVDEYGLVIPKGSLLSLNIYGVHRDPQEWGKDAMVFNPDRWFSEDGTIDKNQKDKLITFGIGPRDCPGAEMARKQLLLVLAHFVWRYRIEPTEGYTANTLPIPGRNDFFNSSSKYPLRYTLL